MPGEVTAPVESQQPIQPHQPIQQVDPVQVPPPPQQTQQVPPATEKSEVEQAAPHESVLPAEDTQRYTEEITRDGKLTDKSYTELERRGFSREMVDTYIQGLKSAEAAHLSSAYEAVGGKQQYDALVAWASKSLSAEQKASYNRIFATGDQMAINMGLKSLSEQYKQAVPSAPQQQVVGGGGAPAQGDVFTSRAEMVAAMTKDEYWNNPEENRKIQEKVQRSIAAGYNLNK